MERVGVVGCGLMGSGIAEVAARAGADVVVIERDREAVAAGQGRIERSLSRAPCSGKLPEAEADAARSRLAFSTDFTRLADREIVVEAVAEEEALKLEVFATLDSVVADPTPCWPPTPLDPDHQAGHGHQAARAGHRHALLQPRARCSSWSRSSRRC